MPRAIPTYDDSQPLTTRSGRDYVIDRNNREHLVRYVTSTGQIRVTALGRHYFQNRRTQYIAHIPVQIRGTRPNGQPYVRNDHLPTTAFGVGSLSINAATTQANVAREVRRRVLLELGVREGSQQIIMDISGEQIHLDPAGQWLISGMSTITTRAASRTDVLMRHVMAGLRSCAAHLPNEHLLLESAFEEHDDRLCVARQLAELLGRALHDICETFDTVLNGPAWRERGVTPEELRSWCMFFGHPLTLVAANELLTYYEPERQDGRRIAAISYQGHCFMYRDARALARYTMGAESTRPVIEQESKRKLEPWSSRKYWEGRPEPGLFYVNDLAAERRVMLESGRSPKVTLRDYTTISQLSYVCVKARDGCSGICRLREEPQYASAMVDWLSRLPLNRDYCGERLPSLSLSVFEELLRAKRRSPTLLQQKELLALHDSRCAMCGELFSENLPCEWDHVIPLQSLTTLATQCFQPLCSECHSERTMAQGRQDRTLRSAFSPRTWDTYVMSPRPPPLVWSTHKLEEDNELQELDVIRCRYNCMVNSSHAFAVYSPLANITPAVSGVLADFSYVAAPSRRSTLSQLPYIGPGWYHRVACEFMLHHGRMTWCDIMWSFHASSHVDVASVSEPLRIMEAAWKGDQYMAKLSANQMIGMMARPHGAPVYHVLSSTHSDDAPSSYHCTRETWWHGDQRIIDYVYAKQYVTNWSYRPIHDQIMHTEHVRIAQLLYILRSLKIPERCVKFVKTDALILQNVAAKAKSQIKDISAHTFEDLPRLRRLYDRIDANQRQIDSYLSLSSCNGKEPVFRHNTSAEPLKGIYRTPRWLVPPPVAPIQWRDVTSTETFTTGLCLEGAPGVGKTHTLRQMIENLREQGLTVHVACKTHAATQNIGCGAVTLDHWVRRHVRAGNPTCDVLVLDEYTQVNAALWSDVVLAHMAGVRIVLSGDRHQFPAVLDHWGNESIAANALTESDMICELSGGRRLILTENMRSDSVIFQFVTSLRPGDTNPPNLQEALAQAYILFPATKQAADWTLTMSHARRHAINRERNTALRPKSAMYCRWKPKARRQTDDPQSFWAWPGLKLIGAGGKVKRGILTQVVSCADDSVELDCGVTLCPEQLVRCVRPCHALTFAGCQGLTLPGRVRLETSSSHFTLRHLYVGCSRATSSALLEVVA